MLLRTQVIKFYLPNVSHLAGFPGFLRATVNTLQGEKSGTPLQLLKELRNKTMASATSK
jgi:hypothetical protein